MPQNASRRPRSSTSSKKPRKTRRPRGKYSHLLQDQDLERWYDNTTRGSRVTADVYLRRLGGFCNNQKTTPRELLQESDDQLENTLLDYVTWAEAEGYAGSYIHSTIKAVKSWLGHNRREIRTKIKIKGRNDTPSLKDERTPTPQELKKILLSGDKKTRTACILVAHSGIRIGVLGNYHGADGLRLGDLPEATIDTQNEEIQFEATPTRIIIRKELSKAGHQYTTFLGEEGCLHLKEYLQERARNGERLEPDSPIITPKTGNKTFITSINIGDIIRSAIRGAGYPWRPYVLRSYFDTRLMLAESKGLVVRDYRQYWMGHKGDIENRYTTNKEKLPPDVIEDMRNSYAQSLQYLETTEPKTSEEEIKNLLRRQLLTLAGFTEEEIASKDLDQIDNQEYQSMIKERLLGEMINNGAHQKVVNIDQVEEHLSQGWEFVASLPNGKAILKLPK